MIYPRLLWVYVGVAYIKVHPIVQKIYLADNNTGTRSKKSKPELTKCELIPCFNVKWPFLFTVILELSIGPGGSEKENTASLSVAVICIIVPPRSRQNTG